MTKEIWDGQYKTGQAIKWQNECGWLTAELHTEISVFFVDDDKNENFRWWKLINFRHKDDDDENSPVFVDETKTKTKIQLADEDDD